MGNSNSIKKPKNQFYDQSFASILQEIIKKKHIIDEEIFFCQINTDNKFFYIKLPKFYQILIVVKIVICPKLYPIFTTKFYLLKTRRL